MKILVLKGLPASGKSTYAKELVKKGWKRVNKDDLRAMIDNSQWSKKNEDIIKEAEWKLADHFLQSKFNVVVDDTNFSYEQFWRDFAESRKVDFEVKFFDVPVDECIERDSKRGDKSVGEKIIRDMYKRNVEVKSTPRILFDPNLPSCYIFDIDGTLAKMDGRSPYDWSKVHTDLANEPIQRIMVNIAANDAAEIFLVSGRDESCRDLTEEWMAFFGFKKGEEYNNLFMRSAGDMRKDVLIKQEIYEREFKGKRNIICVFDDRDQVVKFWRSLGITCLQVAEGDF